MAVLKEKKGAKAEASEEVKTEEAWEDQVETPIEPVKKEAAKPSFFVYLGPSIRGQIQYGSIYNGSREDVEKQLSRQIEKYPRIRKLLVSDLTIVEDRVNVTKPGTRLYVEYKRLVSELN